MTTLPHFFPEYIDIEELSNQLLLTHSTGLIIDSAYSPVHHMESRERVLGTTLLLETLPLPNNKLHNSLNRSYKIEDVTSSGPFISYEEWI